MGNALDAIMGGQLIEFFLRDLMTPLPLKLTNGLKLSERNRCELLTTPLTSWAVAENQVLRAAD